MTFPHSFLERRRASARAAVSAVALVLLVGGYAWFSAEAEVGVPQVRAKTVKAQTTKLALSFAENLGQAHPAVRYESRGQVGTISMFDHDVLLTLPDVVDGDPRDPRTQSRSVAVRMVFDGASDQVAVRAEAPQPTRVNYLFGADASRWITDVHTFGAVRYERLYDGIDLLYDGHEGRLKGTFVVRPGVDPQTIRWHYEGVAEVKVDAEGALALDVRTTDGQVKAGMLNELAPVAWQEVAGRRIDVKVAYHVGLDGSVTFDLGAYDRSLPLTIDPTVVYRSFLGGNGTDHSIDCRVDDQGFMYVVGRTHSRAGFPGNPYPQVNPLFPYGGEIADVSVSKIDPTGTSLVFSTYIGGGNPLDLFGSGGADRGLAIDLNAQGEIAITGFTEATNYPVTSNAAQPTKAGGETDSFVTILNPNGAGLFYSSYVGGSGGDYGFGIEWTNDHKLYLAGFTTSFDFPTSPGAYQTVYAGGFDAFVMKADFVSGYAYSTLLGFTDNEQGLDLAVDPNGDIFVGGMIDSSTDLSTLFPSNFQVHQSTFGGIQDGFVAKIRPAGQGAADLLYMTYLGGSSSDSVWGVDVDAFGKVYVCGITGSSEFPQTSPFFTFQGDSDAFVTKIAANGQGTADIEYSVLFGGTDHDRAFDVCVVGEDAYVCGLVTTLNSVDAFVAHVLPYGIIVSGDLYGDHASFDMGLGVHANAAADRIAVCGYTASLTPFVFPTLSSFPVTPGCFQPIHGSGSGDGNVNVWTLSSF